VQLPAKSMTYEKQVRRTTRLCPHCVRACRGCQPRNLDKLSGTTTSTVAPVILVGIGPRGSVRPDTTSGSTLNGACALRADAPNLKSCN
jgi:hypothetical protein